MLGMDREFSDELTGVMPVVPHGIVGVECTGCIIACVDDDNVELRCNCCGATVGVVQVDVMQGLLGLDFEPAKCPHCGSVNASVNLAEVTNYLCTHCGRSVDVEER